MMPSIINLLTAAFATASLASGALSKKQPNIVFILTDDQDVEMNSLDYMPLLHKYVINEGTLFDRHYCTVAICCPSRVNLWTGRAAHNTNVTDLFPPYGGYPVFVREGLNDDWLPVWLQQEGYNTYYTGKLFNAHSVETYNDPPVNGFNGSDFLLDPYTYEYYNGHMTRNGAPPVSYKGQYSPDVVAEKAYGFLDEAVLHPEPFFLGIAPIAPHSNVQFSVSPPVMDTAFYAPRHAHLFKDYKIPRTANFNPEKPSGVGWVKALPRLNDTVVEYNDEFQRSRLRALQSVDEMVETLVQKLEAHGVLNNTYIFYTTDNGYHIGQHRLHPGKECAFETDIHIPLAVRGPKVPVGHVAGLVSSHSDLSPTLMKLAGKERLDLDGLAIPLTKEELNAKDHHEHVNVEFWGRAIPEGRYGKIGNDTGTPGLGDPIPKFARNNTYKALRINSNAYNLLYVFTEVLECELTPSSSTHTKSTTSSTRKPKSLRSRTSLLVDLSTRSCHAPWETLHKDGKVKTLAQALDSDYDDFYAGQPKVAFDSCQMGYLVEHEGPQRVNTWSSRDPYAGSEQQPMGHWSWYT
ncbi:hypothetical protein AMS68_007508 [Peltaster fructicola]|uniref:Arylsulfatase n=1 Tax=Peltaster fructicola TaxID=286661 RepID=A0A6H0Y501_9PEZI|nr:hypothetical protein AMS68_007508 [Peltaster fructicola]